jgi:hypothetical protein
MSMYSTVARAIRSCSVILFISFIASCSTLGDSVVAERYVCDELAPEAALKAVGSEALIKLPTSYSNLRVHKESGMDTLISFTFKFNRSELDSFVRDIGFEGKLKKDPANHTALNSKACAWFKPQESKEYLTGEDFFKKEALAKQIVLDTSDPETITAYLNVFNL